MRKAFTLIELLFAIVIIAITVMSLPMMMRVNQEAISSNINQEAIFAASAKMMQVLSYPWDGHSQNSNDIGSYTKVVSVATGDNHYYRRDANNTVNPTSSFRVGHVREKGHRRFHYYTSADANASGAVAGIDSLDSMAATFNLDKNSTTYDHIHGYKNDFNLNVGVVNVTDTYNPSAFGFATTSSANPSNLKLIEVNATKPDGTVLVVLRSYSANIGEIDFAKRRF